MLAWVKTYELEIFKIIARLNNKIGSYIIPYYFI